jgi:hypothetical protein
MSRAEARASAVDARGMNTPSSTRRIVSRLMPERSASWSRESPRWMTKRSDEGVSLCVWQSSAATRG